jgi:hypothetical protein
MEPLLGEVRHMLVAGDIKRMVWNGEKWLSYADVYPLIHYALTGQPLNLGDSNVLR